MRMICIKTRKRGWVALGLACLLLASVVFPAPALSVPAGSDFHINGRVANYRFSDNGSLNAALYGGGVAAAAGAGEYDSPLVIRKTVEQLVGSGFDERDFELMLTAAGYDWSIVSYIPVNVVFVIDATSSMGIEDIPRSESDGASVRRWAAAFDAANAYIGALYEKPGEREIETAIVSFGKSARVHFASGSLGGGYTAGVHTSVASLKAGHTDSFIGNYFINTDPDRGRIHDSMETYNEAQDVYAAFTSYFGNTQPFFYDDPAVLTGIVDSISVFSDTNIESGLLMADYLLCHKPNYTEAVNIVMLITDGEANSSSTLSMLENHRDLKKAILGDAAGAGYSGGPLDWFEEAAGFGEKHDVVMGNAAKLSADAGFVGHLYSTLGPINFFTGVYHNLDRMELASRLDPNYLNSGWSDDYLALYARHMFWLAETGTTYNVGNSAIEEFDVFSEYKDGRFATLTSLFYDGGQISKLPGTLLIDYEEHSAPSGGRNQNECGSVAAKKFLLEAASSLRGLTGSTLVYTTGIGSWIVDPGTLAGTASSPDTFYICSNASSANIKNSEALKESFEALGTTHSVHGVQSLVITDLIPRRADSAGPAADDTFAVNLAGVRAGVYFYDGGGGVTVDWRLYDAEDSKWVVAPEASSTKVSYDFGTLYSREVAAEKCSIDYPFKVELRIQIRANTGVISRNADGVPDIDTNRSARVDWRDFSGARSMTYPVPKVYFAPPGGSSPPIDTSTPTVSASPTPSPTSTPETETVEETEQPEETEPPEDAELQDETGTIDDFPPYTPPQPGGNDPGVPPEPNSPGRMLTPIAGDNGEVLGYIEFDEFGVPLGEWHWDDDEEMWIFDPFPPLGDMPQTGANKSIAGTLLILGFALITTGTVSYIKAEAPDDSRFYL